MRIPSPGGLRCAGRAGEAEAGGGTSTRRLRKPAGRGSRLGTAPSDVTPRPRW